MKRLRYYLAVMFGLVLLATPMAVHADVNDFTVDDFTADYVLGTDDPQGSLFIHEQLAVTFTDQNHGILRALPEKYNGHSLHLSVGLVKRDGVAEPFTTYESNGNKVLKIGDANKTITGAHTYDISYGVKNVIRFVDGHDELDWNTNGTEWSQPFTQITARLHVPTGMSEKLTDTACYTGQIGGLFSACTVERAGLGTVYTTSRTLQSGENMTFVANFPTGTFRAPTFADWWQDHRGMVTQLVFPPILAFIFAYRYWHKNGKDIRGRGTIVPEYGPPDDLHAAEADVINHYKLGTNAISATIIDLAIRKYLRIIEGSTKGVLGLGKHKTYSFERLPAPAGDVLRPYEDKILTKLFESGDLTDVSDLKNSFYTTAQAVQKDLPASLTKSGYFPANPKKVGAVMLGVAFAIFFGAWFIFGADWALAVGLIVSAAIIAGFATLMPRRTQKGVDAKDNLAGLKLYMETAEKDRIAMLQSPDAPYAQKGSAPSQTVELFEKLLPFAMVMGVEKQWAKQFESIYTTPPDWYSGNWNAFSAGYLVGSLSSSMSAMNSSFAPPHSSGSGSGGGFSGGGGGGGGGGGW